MNFLTAGDSWWRLFIWLLLLAVAVAMLMPFIWLVSSSLKLEERVFQFPPPVDPRPHPLDELL
jgi:multiple sugar transport system permease protein